MKIRIEGIELVLNRIPKGDVRNAVRVPDVWIHYALHRTDFMGESMILMEPVVENKFSPLRLKYLTDEVAKAYGVPVVVYFERMEYYQRQRMMERGVYFLVGSNYAFLPSLIINAKMADKKPVRMLTPVAQYLLLYHLQVADLNGKTARELESVTPFLYTTLTRAINVLTELQLCEIVLDGARYKHLVFDSDKQSLFEKSKPFLINPVCSVVYADEMPIEHKWPVAGINALSHYSMLNPEQMKTYALTEVEMKQVQNNGRIRLNPIEGAYRLEKWLYPPMEMTGYVDCLSLALSLQDDQDPRVEKEVKQMITKILC